MRKGFIFNHSKCVSCGACSASCILENGWSVRPRKVYTYNIDAISSVALTNLSVACNHCEIPLCLEGCPSSSYTREPVTGAILIDDKKCLGCNFCQWNCPYDAPKFDTEKRIIGKCNLCYNELIDGGDPACSNACPTGALDYGEIPESITEFVPVWFPDKNINPAILFNSTENSNILRIIPHRNTEPELAILNEKEHGLSGIWSLISFSFLITISVSIAISSLINGTFPSSILYISIILLAGIFSLFHLGRKLRAWRAITNFKSSPLSREIILFIAFLLISILTVSLQNPGLLIATSLSGLILLIAIDSVYIYADKNRSVAMHSGQTFISALLIVSFLTGYTLPFIFISLVKIFSLAYHISTNRITGLNIGIRFLRIAILIVSGISLGLKLSYHDPFIFYLFLAGEFFDRLIFYIDFEPVNIYRLIEKHINTVRNETKRS